MMLPESDEGRPTANRAASSVIIPDDDLIVVRCTCCGRELRAKKSVELEMGPICRGAA